MAVADRANNAVLREQDGRWTIQGDPTEGALVVAARKIGLDAAALDARFRRVEEIPFSSRVLQICDAYIAMTEPAYQDPQAHDDVLAIISRAAGTQFDSGLTQRFLEMFSSSS